MRFGTTMTGLAIALGLAGCASGSDSPRARNNAERERTFQFSGGSVLAKAAAFDLGCPIGQMESYVIQRVGMFQVATNVGVHGCGKKASYMRSAGTSGTWVLSSGIQQDAPMQQGAPMPQDPPPPPQ